MTAKKRFSDFRCALSRRRGGDLQGARVGGRIQPNLGKDKDKLAETIDGFDGLAIRSATKVTAKMLERAQNLKVISAAPASASTMSIFPRRRPAVSS